MKKAKPRRASSPSQNYPMMGNYNSTPSPRPAKTTLVHEKRYSVAAQPYPAKHYKTNTADTAIKPYKPVRRYNPPKEIFHDPAHSLSQSQILVNRDDSIERTEQNVLQKMVSTLVQNSQTQHHGDTFYWDTSAEEQKRGTELKLNKAGS